MKHITKIISICLVLTMLLVLVSCDQTDVSGEASVVGTYRAFIEGSEQTVTLHEDNRCWAFLGPRFRYQGTWSQSEDVISMDVEHISGLTKETFTADIVPGGLVINGAFYEKIT